MPPSEIHAALIDAMVAGDDGADLDTAWDWVLSSPHSADAWERAVSRQQHRRALALAMQGRPWLARMTAVLMAARRSVTVPPPRLVLERFPVPAMLGPASDAEEPGLSLTLEWGRVAHAEIDLGAVVELMPSVVREEMTFYYKTASQDGLLPGRRWKLEPLEAPVLLVVCLGIAGATRFEEALGAATALAGVILTERSTTGPR